MNYSSNKLITMLTLAALPSSANALITTVDLEIQIEDTFNGGGINILQRSTANVDNSPKNQFKFEIGELAFDVVQTELNPSAIIFGDLHDDNMFTIYGNTTSIGFDRVTITALGISFDDPTQRIKEITPSSLNLFTPSGASSPITSSAEVGIDGTSFVITYTGTDMVANDFSFSDTYLIEFETIPVPEPSSLAFTLLGATLLLGIRKRA